ncbi:hypothetical protein [Bacteroides sp.]
MELDELKKSWNALDEHLKGKKIVKDEEISQLINHATKNINAISRLNKRLRIISLLIIALFIFTLIYDRMFPDIYYQIILIAVIPALGWDIFSSRYLSNTNIDELPLITVISRFNRIHRWVIRERIIGIGFILFMAVFFFFYREVWQHGSGMILFFFIIWTICIAIPLWIYRKNLERLREIKKNLNELKELKDNN